MPWYYAGPEAKPVGPVSLEELHARRSSGVIAPETYVIEHTGRPGEPREWKRYRELFPAMGSVPPPPPSVHYPPPAPPVPSAHPLFPSAGPAPVAPPLYAPPHAAPYYTAPRPLNGLCLWGFILSVGGFLSSWACIGLFPALFGFFMSLFGFIQVQKNRSQSGRGWAIAGMILSALAILVVVIMTIYLLPKIELGEKTITEQTTNDSD